MKARWEALRYRWVKWLATSRAKRRHDELVFRRSKGYEVTLEEWRKATEQLREAREL